MCATRYTIITFCKLILQVALTSPVCIIMQTTHCTYSVRACVNIQRQILHTPQWPPSHPCVLFPRHVTLLTGVRLHNMSTIMRQRLTTHIVPANGIVRSIFLWFVVRSGSSEDLVEDTTLHSFLLFPLLSSPTTPRAGRESGGKLPLTILQLQGLSVRSEGWLGGAGGLIKSIRLPT